MITEKDVIIQKIRATINRDWKIKNNQKEAKIHKTILLDNEVVQIDPRFTSHA